MKKKADNFSQNLTTTSISVTIEEILGCKWTVIVLRYIAAGISRPGALTKQIPGLSTKVLNERLRKLLRYGVITKRVFNELPPRVEYRLTALGRRITAVLSELDKIEFRLTRRE
jgi:DNA-binding HxlR family transcriptional regulator